MWWMKQEIGVIQGRGREPGSAGGLRSWKKRGMDSPSEPPEGNQPCLCWTSAQWNWSWISDLWISKRITLSHLKHWLCGNLSQSSTCVTSPLGVRGELGLSIDWESHIEQLRVEVKAHKPVLQKSTRGGVHNRDWSKTWPKSFPRSQTDSPAGEVNGTSNSNSRSYGEFAQTRGAECGWQAELWIFLGIWILRCLSLY